MKFTKAAYKRMHYLLTQLYDEETADMEAPDRLKTTFSVGELIQDIEESLYHDDEIFLRNINDNWEQMAGKVFAGISHPLVLKDKTLYIEMKHTTYLSSVSAHSRRKLLENIQNKYGRDICVNVQFLPPGRQA